MDLRERVAALERIGAASTPVVSVYLGTRWADEHQRGRVRIFLKNELAQARRASHPRAASADLDWIEAQGEALLPPLLELDASAPTTLVVFIDTESARLVTLTSAGPGEEVALARAAEYHPHVGGQREAEDVDDVLTAAAKHGKAAAGPDATLDAVNRGAVHRLYLLNGWSMPGRRCDGCGMLQRSFAGTCPACGGEAETLELGEAMADRVVAAGGTVETIVVHQPLAVAGGVAAELRYPL